MKEKVSHFCSAVNCERLTYAKGLCKKHYNRLITTGTTAISNKEREFHGDYGTAEYRIWALMLQRCRRPTCDHWKHYGGRGIKVCDAWQQSYLAFLAYVGRRPSPKHTLDRIDNNGNYEPGNVRWATRLEQNHNTRRNIMLTISGKTRCISEWARELGIPRSTLSWRLKRGELPNMPNVRTPE